MTNRARNTPGAAPEIFGRLTDLLPHNDQDYVRAAVSVRRRLP